MDKIYAGIVLYNPDLKLLEENIRSVCGQVEHVIFVDNASNNVYATYNLIQKVLQDNQFSYIQNDNNYGIAKALNQIAKHAIDEQCDWVLTLDQDSVCPLEMINQYRQYLSLDKVGILCPTIMDRNVQTHCVNSQEVRETRRCITSGSLLNLKAFQITKGFSEKLFIDYVDYEYEIRMMENGYRIYRVENLILLHQLGNSHEVEWRGKKYITTNHSAVRRYYVARNRVYCAKKYKRYVGRKDTILFFMHTFFLILGFENNKIEKIMALLRGCIAGIFLREV